MSDPDFFLASSEGYGLDSPRRAWRIRRMSTSGRDDLLLLKLDPPLLGQKYDLGDRHIDMVLVATRHRGRSLFPPPNEWPIFVHVARPLVEHPELREHLDPHELESIAWAELYRTEADARLKTMS